MIYTPYLEFDLEGITRVGCFKCNETIVKRRDDGQMISWSNKRDIKVQLSDGSMSFIPLCADCLPKIEDSDREKFLNTMKHGWLLEQTWAFKRYPKRGRDSVIAAGKKAKDITILWRNK